MLKPFHGFLIVFGVTFIYRVDNEQKEPGIVVEDFFDFYLYYEQQVNGGRLIYCSECGKLVLSKSGNIKYCKRCKDEVKREQSRESQRRKRNKN